jgi:hypothetical protein
MVALICIEYLPDTIFNRKKVVVLAFIACITPFSPMHSFIVPKTALGLGT